MSRTVFSPAWENLSSLEKKKNLIQELNGLQPLVVCVDDDPKDFEIFKFNAEKLGLDAYTVSDTNMAIDFIAKNQEVLLFIEVKTRQNATFGYPEDAVGKKKEKMIFEAAAAYMDSISYEQEIRFDILTVTMEPKSKIEYFADAFFPLW
jgi:Holliday junction resolvase-like predicted endonuclease